MNIKEEKLARAISAYTRRQILRLLVNKEMTVQQIAIKSELSMSLTSRHLTLLYDLGFVSVRKKSPYKYYSLKIQKITDLLNAYDLVLKKL